MSEPLACLTPAIGERAVGSRRALRTLLAHPLARDLDLDSPEATSVHARLIREKPFLRRLYLHYYADYDAVLGRATPGGLVLEIGSGGGFYPEIRPAVVSLDIRPGADVDIVGSALALPFSSASISAVLLLNVLHHLPDPQRSSANASVF